MFSFSFERISLAPPCTVQVEPIDHRVLDLKLAQFSRRGTQCVKAANQAIETQRNERTVPRMLAQKEVTARLTKSLAQQPIPESSPQERADKLLKILMLTQGLFFTTIPERSIKLTGYALLCYCYISFIRTINKFVASVSERMRDRSPEKNTHSFYGDLNDGATSLRENILSDLKTLASHVRALGAEENSEKISGSHYLINATYSLILDIQRKSEGPNDGKEVGNENIYDHMTERYTTVMLPLCQVALDLIILKKGLYDQSAPPFMHDQANVALRESAERIDQLIKDLPRYRFSIPVNVQEFKDAYYYRPSWIGVLRGEKPQLRRWDSRWT